MSPKRQCDFCQKTDGEFHKCTIEKQRLHCNQCCEQISLGRIQGSTYGGRANVGMM